MVGAGRTILVPLEWIRQHADSNGFALWHYFLEVSVAQFSLLIMGGRLAKFAAYSCSIVAVEVANPGEKGLDIWILVGTIAGKLGGLSAVLYCCYIDTRNKLKNHIPDHMRTVTGRVQVPCWTRICIFYGCALVLAEIFSPRPHVIDWCINNDGWDRVRNEADDTILWIRLSLQLTCVLLILLVVPNDELWLRYGEEVRHGLFPKRLLVIDGKVVSRNTLRRAGQGANHLRSGLDSTVSEASGSESTSDRTGAGGGVGVRGAKPLDNLVRPRARSRFDV